MNFKNVMGKDAGGGEGEQLQQQILSALPRQSSVYSLTFDEFQSTLGSVGKDFGSMNMDEFLKNIWTAEEGQAMAAASSVPGDGAGWLGLQHQGSLTLPRTLSRKTVDEVWRDLLSACQGPPQPASDAPQQPRQPTLGEMTLEEFLLRAGVVREDMAPSEPAAAVVPLPSPISIVGPVDDILYGGTTCLGLGFPQTPQGGGAVVGAAVPNTSAANLAMAAAGTRAYPAPMPLVDSADVGNPQGIAGGGLVATNDVGMKNGIVPAMVGLAANAGIPAPIGSPLNHLPSDGLRKNTREPTSVSPVPYVFSCGPRGRKSGGGAMEKVVERRQRRMIKNRESAARSRARKQAYTMELEAEVAKLKKQNQELEKKQAEMIEMQKNQVLEMINRQRRPKKQCLRRTQTGRW